MAALDYKYSIQLFFDEESEKRIVEIIKRLIDKKIMEGKYIKHNYRPHISLSCHKELDMEYANNATKTLSQISSKIEIEFDDIGTFTRDLKVLYLKPTRNESLYNVHKVLHSKYEKIKESTWELYKPGKWVPHCAIMIDDKHESIGLGLKELKEQDLFSAKIKYIAAVGYKDNKYYEFQ